MKKVHKASALVVAVLALFALAAGFWSIGAFASEDVPLIRIDVVQGPVELKRSGEDTLKPIENSVEVNVGDELKTGEGGKANIRWGDRGETRLDSNTDLVIESAPADNGAATKTLIQLRLTTGRAWSRVLKLLDVESGFAVRTDAVVATVRGTAFGVIKNPQDAELAVTESVVDVTPAQGGHSTLLREGTWGSFSPTGTPMVVRDLLPTDTWPQDNKKADQEFDAAFRKELEERFKKRIGNAPEWLVDMSQNVHVALAGQDEKQNLEAKFFGRKLAEAVSNPSDAERLLKVDPSFLNLQGLARDRVLTDLRFALFLETPRPGFLPPPSFISLLQGLRLQLLSTNIVGKNYALALNVDDRIDGLIFPPLPLPPEDAARLRTELLSDVDGWKLQFANDPSLSSDDLTKLDDKADALHERLILSGAPVDEPPPAPATTTDPTPSDTQPKTVPKTGNTDPQTQPQTPPPVTPPTDQPPVACKHTSLNLFAKPSSNLNIGDKVSLSLYAVCTNGQTDDVTSNASFAAGVMSDGQLNGSVFTPAKSGTITLYGTYTENGTSLTAKTTVTVIAQVRRLISVTAGATGPTALTTGQSAPLTATANYSDGTSADVVYQCVWSTTDAKLGTVSSQRFYTGTGIGTVSAVCGYTDGGVTVSGSVPFTVSLDPSLTPTGGGQPSYFFN
jgi:hypothetical protein